MEQYHKKCKEQNPFKKQKTLRATGYKAVIDHIPPRYNFKAVHHTLLVNWLFIGHCHGQSSNKWYNTLLLQPTILGPFCKDMYTPQTKVGELTKQKN
tara:strand:+ start:119 stop:409 length:291 start_codon:yes stop_codon:yes gene_type:complete